MAAGRASSSSSTSAISAMESRKAPRSAPSVRAGELLGGDDQLVQVLEPALGFGPGLSAQRLAEPGAVDDGRHPFAERPRRRSRRRQLSDEADELPERPPGSPTELLRRVRRRRQERRPAPRRELLHPGERGAPDPARRRAQRSPEGKVVRGIRDEPEVREGVLDLPPLVEAHAAHDPVGESGHPEGVLHHARLGVRPVEHRDAVEGLTLGAQLRHGPRHPERLLALVPRAEEPRRFPSRVLGPETLVLPRLVVRDHRSGDLEDPARRAVVLLEADHAAAREVPLEVQDVPEVRAPEPVDGLVGVPDDAEVPVAGRELTQHPVLGGVGVLVFVDEHVPPELAVVAEHLRVPREELDRQAQEVVEIERARARGVGPRSARTDAPRRPRGDPVRLRQDFLGSEELVLGTRDPGNSRGRSQRSLVQPELAIALAHEREPVGLVVDHERPGIPEVVDLCPKQARARRVEGGDQRRPTACGSPGEDRRHPLRHLPGGLVRERDGEDLSGIHAAGDQVGDAVCDDTGLPATRSGQDEQGPVNVENRFLLDRIEAGEQRCDVGCAGQAGGLRPHGRHAALHSQAGGIRSPGRSSARARTLTRSQSTPERQAPTGRRPPVIRP